MQCRDFAYWLQGYFEIVTTDGHPINLTPAQVKTIQNHLAMVFKHEIDPSMGDKEHQDALNQVHKDYKPGEILYRC